MCERELLQHQPAFIFFKFSQTCSVMPSSHDEKIIPISGSNMIYILCKSHIYRTCNNLINSLLLTFFFNCFFIEEGHEFIFFNFPKEKYMILLENPISKFGAKVVWSMSVCMRIKDLTFHRSFLKNSCTNFQYLKFILWNSMLISFLRRSAEAHN